MANNSAANWTDRTYINFTVNSILDDLTLLCVNGTRNCTDPEGRANKSGQDIVYDSGSLAVITTLGLLVTVAVVFVIYGLFLRAEAIKDLDMPLPGEMEVDTSLFAL